MNPYYVHGSWPATAGAGTSAPARAELDSITAGFAKLPTLSGNGSKACVIDAGGTAITVTTGTLALAGNFATTGAYNTSLTQGASVTLTLPVVSGTLATLAGAESLSNKTLVDPALGTPASGTLTSCTGLPISTGVSGLGSNVATALAVAIGSDGAPVTFNGALGTPSSGAIDACTYNGAVPGSWTTPAFSAGDFTGSGSMTWTVAEADVVTYAYTIINKMMTVSFDIRTTTVAGTPSTTFSITIPASKVSTKPMFSTVFVFDNSASAASPCYAAVAASGTTIDIALLAGGNFAASTNLTYVRGQITFEIN